jgi:hypothetical protein
MPNWSIEFRFQNSMLKFMRLVAIATLASSLSLSTVKAAIGREPDYPCYLRDTTGRVTNLSSMCGSATATSTPPVAAPVSNPNPDSKAAECNQLRQALVQSAREMEAIVSRTNRQNGLQQLERLLELNNRLAGQVQSIQMQDATLISLRSQIVSYLKELNTITGTAVSNGRSGNIKGLQNNLSSLQSIVSRGNQLDLQLTRYCGAR